MDAPCQVCQDQREDQEGDVKEIKRKKEMIHGTGLENLGRLSVALTTERFENPNLTEHFGVNGP